MGLPGKSTRVFGSDRHCWRVGRAADSMTPLPAELPIRFPFASDVWLSSNVVPALSPIRLKLTVSVPVPGRRSGLPPPATLFARIEAAISIGLPAFQSPPPSPSAVRSPTIVLFRIATRPMYPVRAYTPPPEVFGLLPLMVEELTVSTAPPQKIPPPEAIEMLLSIVLKSTATTPLAE